MNLVPLEIMVNVSMLLFVGILIFSAIKIKSLRKGITKARERILAVFEGAPEASELITRLDRKFAAHIKNHLEEFKTKPEFELGWKLFKKRTKQRKCLIGFFIAASALLLIFAIGSLSVISYFYITSLVQAIAAQQFTETWLLTVFKVGIPAFAVVLIALAAGLVYYIREDV